MNCPLMRNCQNCSRMSFVLNGFVKEIFLYDALKCIFLINIHLSWSVLYNSRGFCLTYLFNHRKVDVTVKDDIVNLAKEVHTFHVLFNCAGYVNYPPPPSPSNEKGLYTSELIELLTSLEYFLFILENL